MQIFVHSHVCVPAKGVIVEYSRIKTNMFKQWHQKSQRISKQIRLTYNLMRFCPLSYLYPHVTLPTHSTYAHTDWKAVKKSPSCGLSQGSWWLWTLLLWDLSCPPPEACGTQRPDSHCCEFMNNDNSQALWHIQCDQIGSVPVTFHGSWGRRS